MTDVAATSEPETTAPASGPRSSRRPSRPPRAAVYGGAARAMAWRVEEIVGRVREAAEAAGCKAEKLCFDIRDALDFAILPPNVRRASLLAYARSLLSLFAWRAEEPSFYASYETIAARLRMTVRGAIDVMGRLLDARIIERVHRHLDGMHEPGEARSNVWIFTLPREAFEEFAKQRPARPTRRRAEEAPSEAAPPSSTASTRAPTSAPTSAPSPSSTPRPKLTAEDLAAARELVRAEPSLSRVDVEACLYRAHDVAGVRALPAFRQAMNELAAKAREWGRRASASEALGFVGHVRLAAEVSAAAKPTLADVLHEEAQERARHAATVANAAKPEDVKAILRRARLGVPP